MNITVQNLCKTYKVYQKKPGLKESIKSLFHRDYCYVDAVKNVNFSTGSGEIIGFIGPNGSGKTTTLKMLSGLLRPSIGTIQADSYIPYERKKDFLKQVGFVMGQKGQLWWDLPALDSYDLLIDIYECNRKETMDYVYRLAEELNIQDYLKTPVKKLSLGQRMKTELIAAVLHKPEILLLDEPTIGLDIYSVRSIRNIIKEEFSQREMVIILSSHNLDDIEELCKRLIIINNGRLVYDDLLERCYEKYLFQKQIKIRFKQPIQREALLYADNIIDYSPYEVCWGIDRHLISKVSYEMMQSFYIDDINIAELSLGKAIEYITKEGQQNGKIPEDS
jgi:ABC-2 type transport system ATP-binding protein